MMEVTFQPVRGGILEVMVYPHPFRGQPNVPVRVGYCREGDSSWSLIGQHDLAESHIALVSLAVEKRAGLRTAADSAKAPAAPHRAATMETPNGDS